ncbi:MAG: DUF937 domain-containing protein [Candidatus Accumulibacter sp.]|uniref:YidB family protein n=1 Tax=Accumulibacter sp. TaxID=2053492 RepID=UPI001A5EFC4C|nr:YidB family protein [Accumulibacter sp.]MBL8392233.1 DUF937 domain-containing protein [Accumulibacter sp.]HRD89870.1 YidB family protein [Accumulibacter sp.]
MGLLNGILGGVFGNEGGESPAAGQAGGGNPLLAALLPVVLGMLLNRQGGATSAAGGGGLADVLGGMLGGGRQGAGLGDALGGRLGGGGGGSGTAGLGSVLGGLLAGGAGGAGGLGALLEQFQRAGFGEQASSWVSTGDNLPLPPGAIGQVFGDDALAQIARQAGVSEAEAGAGLAQLLPEVIDRVTPGGQAPDLDQLVASVANLTRQFGGG